MPGAEQLPGAIYLFLPTRLQALYLSIFPLYFLWFLLTLKPHTHTKKKLDIFEAKNSWEQFDKLESLTEKLSYLVTYI